MDWINLNPQIFDVTDLLSSDPEVDVDVDGRMEVATVNCSA